MLVPPFGTASIRAESLGRTIVVRHHLVTLCTTPDLSIMPLTEYELLRPVNWHAGYRGDVCIGNTLLAHGKNGRFLLFGHHVLILLFKVSTDKPYHPEKVNRRL